jgi:hypothetical protein
MEQKQLAKFIEALESDPGHAGYLLGLRHNAALQYHAVNVSIVNSMTESDYFTDAPKLYPREFAELQRIADQCVALGEALDKDPITLQAVDLFQSVAAMARVAQSTPEPEPTAEPVAEAGMMVKCPKCGEEFAAKMAAEKEE